MKKQGLLALLLGSIVVACCSCKSNEASSTPGEDSSRVAAAESPQASARTEAGVAVYSKYNIHFISEKGKNKASYANLTEWPGHDVLPYNSKIQARAVTSKEIEIKDLATGKIIEMEFHPTRMGMSAKEYINLITSPTPVNYEGLSDVDRQGIQAGKAMVGMSKQGVMVALGYPAKHQTPSPDQNRWIYWKGRFETYAVEFDNSGKVASITK